jgi:class 3 adenylate cyclase/tetratricopeptide (TPR) repeat protein
VAADSTAERRLVSVLFADLVGFTSLAQDRDAEAVRDMLTRYFDAAREIVERYGGTIEKFIGDAVMAVWGTPTAHEDDAERAVRAALDLVDAARTFGAELGAEGLELRAGVLTGEAAVTIGAQGQGMVAGDMVNTASRLQSVAPPGTVLVGEATHRVASGAIAFEPAGEQMLKGKEAPVVAFRALRVIAKRGGAGRSQGLEAPFVGREDELRLLKDLFHATARERRARLISITGQAGIGKSRLAWEFLKYLDGIGDTVYWHQGRSPAYGEGVTFWALGEMVRRRAGLLETDDEPTTRARIHETLDEWLPDAPDRAGVEHALLMLLGLEEAPSGGRDQLFAAWRTFFEQVAERGPAVLLFEDLQWADKGLLDFIDHVLEWSRDQPIYIVTLARPELLDRRTDWGAGRRNFLALGLEPLAGRAMREMLAGLVPGLPERAVRSILARADGVPLYAVETVRMLVAEGRLEVSGGSYRPVGDLTDLAVPDSLHGLIAARLDALDPAERALLQDGAVLGQTFSLRALAALTGRTPEELEPRLRALVRREVLSIDTDPLSPERGHHGFTQGLIREVAYSTLAKRDRRARHLAAARYYESLEDEEIAGALASHYLDAYRASPQGAEADALRAQARLALRGAAERAAGLGSYEQAITYLEQALTVTVDEADRADQSERIGRSMEALGRYDEAESVLRQVIESHRGRGDMGGVTRATAHLARALLSGRRTHDVIALLELAGTESVDLGSDGGLVEQTAQLARAYMFNEEPERALRAADRALVVAERLDLLPIVADVLITKGNCLAYLGRLREGVGLLEAGQRLADGAGLVETSLRAAVNLSGLLPAIDPRAALSVARTGYELARRLGQRSIAWVVLTNAAEAALTTGDWDRAVAEIDDALSLELDRADRVGLLASGLQLHAVRGDPVGAALAELEELAADDPDVQTRAAVLLSRTWLAFAGGRPDAAHTEASEVASISALNAPPAYLVATRAALTLRDSGRARAALEGLEATGVRGPALAMQREAMEAGLAALEGRRGEAISGFRDTARRLSEVGMVLDVALNGLLSVQLLGRDDADARILAGEARETFLRLGARPFIEQLDEAPAGTDGREPGSVPVSEKVSAAPRA